VDRHRVVEVLGALSGSGFLLGDRLVLTAAHLLCAQVPPPADPPLASGERAAEEVLVRPIDGERTYLARCAWSRYDGQHHGLDAALLEITDPAWTVAAAPPVGWGRLEGSAEVRVHAFGFPDAAVRTGQAELSPVIGIVHTASGGQSGRPEIVVAGEPERASGGESLWAGLSGGPVLSAPDGVTGDVLLGVVTGDPAEFASRRLRMIPVSAVLADSDAAAVLEGHIRNVGSVPYPAASDGSSRDVGLLVTMYLRALISWLSSDPWPQHRRFGGPPLAPPAIERKLQVSADGSTEQRDADDLVGQCQRLVVLGGPGSGKTWLARRAARRCAQKALRALTSGARLDQVELPLYTTCASLFTAEGDIRSAIVSSALSQIGDMGGSRVNTAVGTLLTGRNDRTLVVIDSLDEARGSSERLRQADTLPWRIVLTSRPASWDNQLNIEKSNAAHCVAELRPLRYPADVESFIALWFEPQAERGVVLAEQIAGNPGLQLAATVPLVLAMYCVVGGGSDPLPEFRRDLYDKVLAYLLTSQWRGGGAQANISLCLKRLTEWALAWATSDVVSGIGSWPEDVLTEYEMLDPADRVALDNVAWPLGPPSVYDGAVMRRFIHRSIREHLVARHTAALEVEEAVDVLLPHLWYDPDWIYTAADAIVGHPQRDRLVLALIHAASSDADADVDAIDVGGEFRVLLSRVASQSGEADWEQTTKDIISQARIELAKRAPPGTLDRATRWPSSLQVVREELLSRIRPGYPWAETPELVLALCQLEPKSEERQRALDALLYMWPKSPKHFTDPAFRPLQAAEALAEIAETADERRQAREMLLGTFAGPPSSSRSIVADIVRRYVVQLTETADERRQARETLLGFVAEPNPSVQAAPWTRMLLQLDPTDQEKGRAREALLSILAQTRSFDAEDQAIALLLLDPTDQEKERAREVLLSKMPGEAQWPTERLARMVLRLGATGQDRQRIRQALDGSAQRSGKKRARKLAHALLQVNPTRQDGESAREALLAKVAADSSHLDFEKVAGWLVKLAVTADERHSGRKALLTMMTASQAGGATRALVSALVTLDPAASEKEQVRQVLLKMLAEKEVGQAEGLVDVLLRLDPTSQDRQIARETLLGRIPGDYGLDVEYLARGLIRLAVNADEKHSVRQALLSMIMATRSGDIATPLASALVEFEPTQDEKRQAREALISLAPLIVSGYRAPVLYGELARLNPTLDDISTWRTWPQRPTRGLLMAVRRNSTSQAWLAALDSLPKLTSRVSYPDPVIHTRPEPAAASRPKASPFERFTDQARRAMVLADGEARMLNHHYIGTEHILLGLIHEGEGVAAKAFESLGISLEAVRQQVEEIIGQGQQAPPGHIPFTPRAKKVLELSLREALQLGRNFIRTEHILLGLIREGEGVAAWVLVRLGADLNSVRQQVIQLLHSNQSKDQGPESAPRASRFERLTDQARRVVILAQQEARTRNHNYVGTEHILLGLIHEGESVAAKALESLGISLEAVRQQVDEIIGQGQQPAPPGLIPFTLRTKNVLELSPGEALQLGHNYIGTEHILLGLIREGGGVAAQVLVRLGADLNSVRQQVIQLLHNDQSKDQGSESAPPTC
jgi:hypothetical protein